MSIMVGATSPALAAGPSPTGEVERLWNTMERRRSAVDRSYAGFSWTDLLRELGPQGRAGEIREDADLGLLPRDLRALRVVGLNEQGRKVIRWVDTEAVTHFRGVEIHHQHIGSDADGQTRFVREGYIYPHHVTAPRAPAPPSASEPVLPMPPKAPAARGPSLEALLADVRAGRMRLEAALLSLDAKTIARETRPTLVAAGAPVAEGLGVSPGVASGVLCFDLAEATRRSDAGEKVILVRQEIRPEESGGLGELAGMIVARGGYSSHAAVVARERGIPCVNLGGVPGVTLDEETGTLLADGRLLKAGDAAALDAEAGKVYAGRHEIRGPGALPALRGLVDEARGVARLRVWANADTPAQVKQAIERGAEGIGLCRTEHMFLDAGRRLLLQKLLLAPAAQHPALARELAARHGEDLAALLRAARGAPVKIRLLDPPMHELLPALTSVQPGEVQPAEPEITALAAALGEPPAAVRQRVQQTSEVNPMLGLRGVRLGMARPEIYQAQVEALATAMRSVRRDTGIEPQVTVVLPMVSQPGEVRWGAQLLEAVFGAQRPRLGVMIETPAAALWAADLAALGDEFSIGSNDMTQMTVGISRDDADSLPRAQGIFRVLEQETVGKMVSVAVALGRSEKPDLKVSLCGAHGSDPSSIEYLDREAGLDSVSVAVPEIESSWIAAARSAAGGRRLAKAGSLLEVRAAPQVERIAAAPAIEPARPTAPAVAVAVAVAVEKKSRGGESARVRDQLKLCPRKERPQHSKTWAEIVARFPGQAGFIAFGDDEGFFREIGAKAVAQGWIRVIYGGFPEGQGFRFATEEALKWCMADTGHQGMDPEQRKTREGYVKITPDGLEVMSF